MNIILINWIIGGTATILMIYAAYITLQASKKLGGELKRAVLLLTSSLLAYLLMGLGTGAMAAKDVNYNEPVWLLIPSLALIGGILFVIGAKKLFSVLLSVSKNNKKEVKK